MTAMKHAMSTRSACIPLMIIFTLWGCENKKEEEAGEYLAVVQRYADTMLEHGRDTYGKDPSPLFASALDARTLKLPEGDELKILQDLDPNEWGIRKNDRVLSGANVMHQENLYQVLYGLTAVTGEPRYAREADESLRYFLKHCQSPATGLFAWGEHMGWDFRTDTLVQHYNEIRHSVGEGTTHEFYRPWVLWQKFLELDGISTIRFTQGLWEHQIYDHETGDFSRHARWDRHGPGKNSQYPRHGGFYIAAWGAAYRETFDARYLKAIHTLLGFFERNRSGISGAIRAEVGNARSQGKMMWPSSNLSLAIDLWDALQDLPDSLATLMRRRALRTDSLFLRVPHDVGPEGKGFVILANVHTLAAEDVAGMGTRVTSHLWATGYGDATDAQVANTCYLRYNQTMTAGYHDLVLAAADRYMSSEPELTFPIYPGTMGDVIYLMLAAYELSGNRDYLERADHFAGLAIALFLKDNRPLPAASSKHDHYEAITREDTLMMALLKLYCVRNEKKDVASLIWCDR